MRRQPDRGRPPSTIKNPMACYLPDHLVRCSICKHFFSDARRLRCGCVYCYQCCLTLVDDYTLRCRCSVEHRFKSSDDLVKALVIDTVVNDLVRQRTKQDQIRSSKLVNETSIQVTDQDQSRESAVVVPSSHFLPTERKTVAVAQPPCSICKKKTSLVVLCQHCQSDICELCMAKHYEGLTESLQQKWMECLKKFHQINAHVSLSHQNKLSAISKLGQIRETIEERTRNIRTTVENHRQILAQHIDRHIETLEHIIKTNNVDNEYQSMRARLSRIIKEESDTPSLFSFLEKTEDLLQRLILRDKQMKEMESKIPYLSASDSASLDVTHLIGELKFDDQPVSSSISPKTTAAISTSFPRQIDVNDYDRQSFASTRSGRSRFPRRMRPCVRSRGGPYASNPIPNDRPAVRYPARGRFISQSRPPSSSQVMDMKFDFVPNHQHRWSIDFKEIPYFLTVFDNRHRAYQPDTPLRQRHDHLLFVSDDHGQLGIYSLPESTSYTQPSLVGTAELFSKNSSLLLESFAVCELAIVVYVRRFEQRTNEIEHSKLIKAGLPIMTGEQGRCNDHGGMIYLFTHDGKEIDGVYQAHPIRIILADAVFGRLWALNPMENNVYSYITPTSRDDVRKCLQEEEIVLDLSNESFEPSTMIQSKHALGLIDTEQDAYRLYAKDDSSRLITTYQNTHQPQWKITGGVIFQDNRTLLKLTEDRYCTDENDRTRRNVFPNTSRRRLIELTADGEEKRQIRADTLYSLTLGPNDEIILGFAVRGDRGLVQCY